MGAKHRPRAKREHWSAEAGATGVAQIEIPADARRDRRFEISVRFVVVHQGSGAWHALRVRVNGALEWSRQVPTHAGASDSLDYRLRRSVPSGEPLRLVAAGEVHRAARLRLRIDADEEDEES